MRLLAAGQAVYGCVSQAAFILAALVVFTLTNSATLAGLATAVIWGGRVLIVYQTGRLMDRVGRRLVLLLGFLTTCISLLLMGSAVIFSQVQVFWLGLLAFGFGSGIIQQTRIAVLDMYPVERRGEGLGLLLTASIIGSLLSPVFTASMLPLAGFLNMDPYAVILLVSTLILGIPSLFILLLGPDPRDIGRNLEAYYPEANSVGTAGTNTMGPKIPSILFLPILAGFVASALAWGDMSMMMSLVPLILHQHHVVLTLISVSITLHVFGMYALSYPLGWLSDRVGRRIVTILGGLLLGAGALLTPLTSDYWMITFSIFLVGLGWSAANVATSALLSDLTPVVGRGRILGANDVSIGLASLALPALGGLVISGMGFLVFGISGFLIAVPVIAAMLPVREVKPGTYRH